MKKEIAIALEGGGAKGAYQVGAIKALKENGYTIKAITGTSIGALNAVGIVQNDMTVVYDFWNTMTTAKMFEVDETVEKEISSQGFNRHTVYEIAKVAKKTIKNLGIDTTYMKSEIDRMVNEEALRNSDIDFGLVTYNVSNFEHLELFIDQIPKGEINKYLMATAYHPVFRLKKMDGALYIDGGIADNCPYTMLAKKGYENIFAIRTNQHGELKPLPNNADVQFIVPSVNLGSTLDFSPEKSNEKINLGYFDTIRFLNGYKGRYYYIKPKGNAYFIEQLMQLSDVTIYRIAEQLALPTDKNGKRLLFEDIIPNIEAFIHSNPDDSYEDLAIDLLEAIALKTDIERFKIYDYDDFYKLIFEKVKSMEKGNLDKHHYFTRFHLHRKKEHNDILFKIAVLIIDTLA